MTTETQNDAESTFYNTMYEYVHDADVSHYQMSGDGKEDYQIAAFNPAEDADFAIDIDNPIEHDGKTYIPVCWGETESSALLESEIDTAQCYILYRYVEDAHGYISDGRVYETHESADQVKD